MKDKDIIQKLSEFSKIEPDEKWYHVNRSILFNIIKNDTSKKRSMGFKSFYLYTNIFFRNMMPSWKTASVLSSVFIVIFTTVFGANAALPGNILYPVKLTMEKGELMLTKDGSVEQVDVYFKHINKRLEEMDKLVENNNQAQITKVADNIKNNLDSLKNNLETAKKDNKDSQKTIEVAKLVDERTQQTSEILKATAEKVSNDGISEVIKANNLVSKTALDMIINNENTSQDQNLKELVEKSIENRILLQSDRLEEVDKKIEQGNTLSSNQDVINTTTTSSETINSENKSTIEFSIETIKQVKANQIPVYLEEAKKLLQEGKYQEALLRLKEVEFYIDLSEEVLENSYKNQIQELEKEINSQEVKGQTEQKSDSSFELK
ncbi:MAG: DUF5667 domain-containing protein [Patescibacteria group bacterium]|nr:DUF5667 domain-containing protein [Patescibacteria group bacterium]MDD4304696.1 DUF5667 domain-containing protein [Patescibacteria group bacterium]MDD4695336.1 DUF5667 domain-containing protein [Patescibacteria group bacterium]